MIEHRRIRDQFRLGGLIEVSCRNILSIACPKIMCFCPKMAI